MWIWQSRKILPEQLQGSFRSLSIGCMQVAGLHGGGVVNDRCLEIDNTTKHVLGWAS